MIARRIIEHIKWIEGINVPLLAGFVYKLTTSLDNYLISREKLPMQPLNTKPREKKITVSLTSFPARIEYVHIAIKSLMLQTHKPDRIILWLAETQFPDKSLPPQLKELQKFGLEIKWCEDLYGHKRYVYCVKDQEPDEVIITYDDDIIYSPLSIRRLMETHRRFPDCLVCERAQALKYDVDGKLANPGRWDTISDVGIEQPSFSLNPSPGGGLLIPYNALSPDATDINKIKELAFKQDDLWTMFMAAEHGTRIIKTHKWHRIFSVVKDSQTTSLASGNVIGGAYIGAVLRLAETYPSAYDRIINK